MIEARYEGRREEEQQIGNGAKSEVGIKGSVEISLRGALKADQGLLETGIHNTFGNGQEHRHHGNQPVIGRHKVPSQKQGNDSDDAPSGDLLCKVPDYADGGFFS